MRKEERCSGCALSFLLKVSARLNEFKQKGDSTHRQVPDLCFTFTLTLKCFCYRNFTGHLTLLVFQFHVFTFEHTINWQQIP